MRCGDLQGGESCAPHLQLALRVFQSCHHVLGQLPDRLCLALLQHFEVTLDALRVAMQHSKWAFTLLR